MSARCRPTSTTVPPSQERDLVAPLEHQRARRHDDRGAAGPCGLQRLGDPRLGVRVDRAGRLVQHEDGGVGDQGAGEDEPLALAAGQRPATLLDLGVQAVRQRVEDVVGVGGPHRRHQGGVVPGGVPERVELAAQGAGEQPRVLVADEHQSTDGVDGEVGERDPAEGHPGASASASL